MRDQNQRKVVFLSQAIEQFQYLCLNRDIECRCGLIRDYQHWVAYKRHCDHDALPHSAGKLVRIIFGSLFCVGNRNRPHCIHSPQPGFAFRDFFMGKHGFSNLKADFENGIQRRHWLLENHGDLRSAHLADLSIRQRHEVSSVEQDFARDDPARGTYQA